MILEGYRAYSRTVVPGVRLHEDELATLRQLQGEERTAFLAQMGTTLGQVIREDGAYYDGIRELNGVMTDQRPVVAAALTTDDRETVFNNALSAYRGVNS